MNVATCCAQWRKTAQNSARQRKNEEGALHQGIQKIVRWEGVMGCRVASVVLALRFAVLRAVAFLAIGGLVLAAMFR